MVQWFAELLVQSSQHTDRTLQLRYCRCGQSGMIHRDTVGTTCDIHKAGTRLGNRAGGSVAGCMMCVATSGCPASCEECVSPLRQETHIMDDHAGTVEKVIFDQCAQMIVEKTDSHGASPCASVCFWQQRTRAADTCAQVWLEKKLVEFTNDVALTHICRVAQHSFSTKLV